MTSEFFIEIGDSPIQAKFLAVHTKTGIRNDLYYARTPSMPMLGNNFLPGRSAAATVRLAHTAQGENPHDGLMELDQGPLGATNQGEECGPWTCPGWDDRV